MTNYLHHYSGCWNAINITKIFSPLKSQPQSSQEQCLSDTEWCWTQIWWVILSINVDDSWKCFLCWKRRPSHHFTHKVKKKSKDFFLENIPFLKIHSSWDFSLKNLGFVMKSIKVTPLLVLFPKMVIPWLSTIKTELPSNVSEHVHALGMWRYILYWLETLMIS